MDKTFKYIIGLIICIIMGIVIGIYIGNIYSKNHVKEKIIYEKGDEIRDSIPYPYPVIVESPIDTESIIKQCIKDSIFYELFPEKIKEVTVYIPEKEDTSAIMKDWATKRVYSNTLFDSDTLGTLNLNTTIQYNRIFKYEYSFNPNIKTIIQEDKKPTFMQPLIGIGATTMPSFVLMGGVLFKEKIGANFLYQYDFKTNKSYYGGSIIYSF